MPATYNRRSGVRRDRVCRDEAARHQASPQRDHLGQLVSAVLPLAIYSAIVEGPPLSRPWTRTAVLSGVYLALFGSVTGAWLNYWLLKRIGATKLLSMGLIEPLVAVLLGAIFLHEQLTGKTVAGGVLILIAVGVVLDLRRAKSSS